MLKINIQLLHIKGMGSTRNGRDPSPSVSALSVATARPLMPAQSLSAREHTYSSRQ